MSDLFFIFNLYSNFLVILVSSHKIKSTSCNVLIALNDKSPRLPIGVETTYKHDFSKTNLSKILENCYTLPYININYIIYG